MRKRFASKAQRHQISIKFICAYLCLNVFAAISTFAQQPYSVNLETVLKLAGANNLTVQEYQLKYQESLADVAKAKEWWLPNIYAGATTHYLHGGIWDADGIFYKGIHRSSVWAGLGFFTEIDFSKGFYSALAAKQKAEAMEYRGNAEKNKTILQAVQTYFDLQAEQLKYILLSNLVSLTDTLSQQIKIKVDAGLLYQSDYLLSQSNYNHLKISMLQSDMEWRKKSAVLANLLNIEKSIQFISADTALVPVSFNSPSIDTTGFKNRPEYMGMNSELQSIEALKKTIKQGLLLPRLTVGFDNGGLGGYTQSLYNTYQYNASLFWTLPLGRLTYKGDLKKYDAQILIQENKIEQFRNLYQQEISEALSQLQISGEQINTAKLALQASTEALNQSMERQKIGTAKAFEVFQAQQFYLQAQIDYLKSVSEYNKAQFALKVAKGEML